MRDVCEYDSNHWRYGVEAVGVVESPITGSSPACQECIDHFNDNLCDGCSMPSAWCECDNDEEE